MYIYRNLAVGCVWLAPFLAEAQDGCQTTFCGIYGNNR